MTALTEADDDTLVTVLDALRERIRGDETHVLAPLLLSTPPSVGSRRPKDLMEQLRLAWGLRGLDVRGTADATRLFTMSIRDVLDEWFESPEVQGLMAINAVIGTWAGPDEAGTAYVMMHHTIGDVGDGHLR